MPNSKTDPLAIASVNPHVGDLLNEYQRSMVNSSQGNLVTKFDNIRFARWSGQTDDGKKHSESRPEGSPAWPFEGASDVRNRLIDSSCNELTALLVSAFQKADIRSTGTDLTDMTMSSIATTLLHWIRDSKMPQQLSKEAELGAQYALQYGWSAFFVGWQQHISKRSQPISMDEIMQLAQQSGSQTLMELPQLIMEAPDQAAAILQAVKPDITQTDAKRMVSELAETGQTSYDEDPRLDL